GGMNTLSSPIASVGRPSPTMPLTAPAAKKTAATAGQKKGSMGGDGRGFGRLCPSGIGVGILRPMRRLEPRGPVRLRADPQDLRLFLAVFEAGSITAASQRVHLSLAAASERLQALESSIGTPL